MREPPQPLPLPAWVFGGGWGQTFGLELSQILKRAEASLLLLCEG